MIKLYRLYSKTGLFKEIKFSDGLNIIFGKCSDIRRSSDNGIGKSSVVRMIDYALTGDNSKKTFKLKKYDFLKGHTITLEFFLENEKYFINRDFVNFNKIGFGKENDINEYTEKEIRKILGAKFLCMDNYNGFIDNKWFRTLMRFFVKDDLKSFSRATPTNFSHNTASKLELIKYNLFLLNLPNSGSCEYEKFKTDKDKNTNLKNELKNDLEDKNNKTLSQVKNEVNQIKVRIEDLEKCVEEFKFIDNYKEIENKLIKLNSEINDNIKTYNSYTIKLQNYENTTEFETEIDVSKIARLYEVFEKELGKFIKNSLNDIIDFRKTITENRKRYIQNKRKELKSSIEKVVENINKLEEQRSKIYKLLDEKNAFESIKNTYERLIEEKTKYENEVSMLRKYDKYIDEIAELNIKLSQSRKKIIDEMHDYALKIEEIRSVFFNILKNGILVDESTEGASFDVITNPETNKNPISIEIQVPKTDVEGLSDSLGQKRFKLLSYDLTVFFSIINSNRKIPHFLVHDGVFHSVSLRTIINILNYINSLETSYKFQYIITLNESDISIKDSQKPHYGELTFDINDKIIAEFDNIPERMFFMRDF